MIYDMVIGPLLTSQIESQNASKDGKNGAEGCQLLMLADRSLHAEHHNEHLQRNESTST